MNLNYYVYAHYNKTTGEIFYIGKGQYRRAYDAKNRSLWWKSYVSKYGVDIKIIEHGLSQSEANDKEKQLIAEHGRKDLGLGPLINLTDGGDGIRNASAQTRQKISYRARNISNETRKKMSESAKRRSPMSNENKQKLRERWTGDNNPNRKFPMSDEYRRKLSEAHKGKSISDLTKKKLSIVNTGRTHTVSSKRKMSEACKQKRSVRQVTLSGEYVNTHSSIKEAAKATGCTNISACCRGIRRSSGGYLWNYGDV